MEVAVGCTIVVGIAVGWIGKADTIVGKTVGDGIILTGCSIITRGEQAVTKINKPNSVNLVILMIDIVFISLFLF